MEAMRQRIHDESNGLDYVRCVDYYIPDVQLDGVVKSDPIGKWAGYTEITFEKIIPCCSTTWY